MKNWFVVIMIAAGIYWFTHSGSGVDRLMEVDESAIAAATGSIEDVYPEPGSEIDADMLAEYGTPTVLYLYMESCNACEPVEKAVDRLITHRPDVAVKRLHVKYGYGLRLFSQGENLWSIHTPFVVIYDRKGKRVSTDIGGGGKKSYDGYHMLFDWVNAEARKAYDSGRG
jgi:hypothetical protein